MHIEVPVQQILELSCSAYRTNGKYIKEHEIYEVNIPDTHLPNKIRILSSLGIDIFKDTRLPPRNLKVLDEDKDLADKIRVFYKRLAFKVMSEENLYTFDTTLFTLLNKTMMSTSDAGYIAYLPHKYQKESTQTQLKKLARTCEDSFLSEIGSKLFDLDSEIIEVYKSKNYDAYNVTAIIDNKMCSWMSNRQLSVGPAVIVKAIVKDHSTHYSNGNKVTRLHYVKAAQ